MVRIRLENRSGKVIALGRLALSVVMVAAVLSPRDGGPDYPDFALAIALGYVTWSAALLAATWSNWWLEHRLRLPSHLIDLAFFIAISVASGFNVANPFFIFFVFLVLSAATRWGLEGAALTAIAAAVLFGAEAAIQQAEATLTTQDYARAIVRAGHLLVISLMIGWFGLAQVASRRAADRVFPDLRSPEPPLREAVDHMAECLDAGVTALIWSDPQEPWLNLAVRDGAGFRIEREPPAGLSWIVDPGLEGRTFLFDVGRRRALFPSRRRLRTLTGTEPVNPALAEQLGCAVGLATPLAAEAFDGWFVAGRIDGMCWDDLPVARKATTEIARAFNRSAALAASAAAAESRTRLRVARDLHDSVSQILAGIALKVRAARAAADPRQGDKELCDIEAELVHYQQDIRELIEDLRSSEADSRVDLGDRLRALAEALAGRWRVAVTFDGDPGGVARGLAAEIGHLVREAVGNAVRHGAATRVDISAEATGEALVVRCRDNGLGFGANDGQPRSIRERARLLGGSVALESSGDGAIVTVTLPLGPDAR